MKEKIKIFVISDHPYSPSGVGTQTRYMIESLLDTGEFSFICFGGAIKISSSYGLLSRLGQLSIS